MEGDLAIIVPLDVGAGERVLEDGLGAREAVALEDGDLAQGLQARPERVLAQPDRPARPLLADRQAEPRQPVRDRVLEHRQRRVRQLLLEHVLPRLCVRTYGVSVRNISMMAMIRYPSESIGGALGDVSRAYSRLPGPGIGGFRP